MAAADEAQGFRPLDEASLVAYIRATPALAASLVSRLAEDDNAGSSNLVLSPLSIYAALALLAAGADPADRRTPPPYPPSPALRRASSFSGKATPPPPEAGDRRRRPRPGEPLLFSASPATSPASSKKSGHPRKTCQI